ncbi:MAG: hypothetical protein DBW82_08965 [Synechococcus sp. MED-G68]|nr:hypothetical protein SynPROS91_00695 [Synechococcus sp. PROS-9-1]RCL57116.1 MAG: hypothetical protein DBW82_08965 [Synechococcus sp. MED-G68]
MLSKGWKKVPLAWGLESQEPQVGVCPYIRVRPGCMTLFMSRRKDSTQGGGL